MDVLRKGTLFSLDGVILMMKVRSEDIYVLQKLLNTYVEGYWQKEVLLRAMSQVDSTLLPSFGSYLVNNVLEICPACAIYNEGHRAKCSRCREPLILYRQGVQDV